MTPFIPLARFTARSTGEFTGGNSLGDARPFRLGSPSGFSMG